MNRFQPQYYPYIPPEVLRPYEDIPPGVPPGRITSVTENGMRILKPFHDESLMFCIPARNPPPPNAWLRTPPPWSTTLLPGITPSNPYASPMQWQQPLASAPPLELNPQLSINFDNPVHPWIFWDITHPPEISARLYDRPFLHRVQPNFEDPAFTTRIRKVRLVSTHPVLSYWMKRWGLLTIRSSENLTVGDVLNAIYKYLRELLTPDDISHINTVPGNQKSLRLALKERAKDSRAVEAVVIAQGYRRVDVLGGHRRFQGLHVQFPPEGSWQLSLSLLPGPVPP
ncbi:hypothetical protein JR316_0003405 [Psilocybe cubensis]|uniref:DUF6699 domain-containing protein n=2 Tax=Psilocybe cubensis TaxID=181762 RepID=A0A8H8CMX6_PSICU|nr:hypothetical protein JR316_0003405 [Psilocybe cubensis]KAH9483927.1 hypothetical protein JR316_0003405 [Psilocybe cubensis]